MLATRFGRGYGPVVRQAMPGMSSTAHFIKLLSEKPRIKSIPEEYIQHKLDQWKSYLWKSHLEKEFISFSPEV